MLPMSLWQRGFHKGTRACPRACLACFPCSTYRQQSLLEACRLITIIHSGRGRRVVGERPHAHRLVHPAAHQHAAAQRDAAHHAPWPGAQLAPLRRQNINAAGYEAAPTAFTMGTIHSETMAAPVRKIGLNTTGHEAGPTAFTMGTQDMHAEMAQVRKHGLHATGSEAPPTAVTMGTVPSSASVHDVVHQRRKHVSVWASCCCCGVRPGVETAGRSP